MKNISLVSVLLAIAYWVIESMMDTLVIPRTTVMERFFSPDANELWMRLTIVSLILSFGAYAQYAFVKIRKSDERLLRMNACFLNFGPDPIENIDRLTTLCKELTGASTVFYERLDREHLLPSPQHSYTVTNGGEIPCPDGAEDSSGESRASKICHKLLLKTEDVLVTHGPNLNPACPAHRNSAQGFGNLAYQTSDSGHPASRVTCMRKAVSLGNELIGSLCVVFFSDFSPGEDDKRLLNIIASAISVEEVRRRSRIALQESEERLRHLSSELLRTQELERKNIARQLHDGIGQSLSALKFSIEETLELLQGEVRAERLGPLLSSVPLIRQIVDEIRRIQRDLFPPTLDELGIIAAINSFSRQYREIYRNIRMEVRIEIQEEEVPKQIKMVIYRIMQEAMNNIAKHSGADFATLCLKKSDDFLQLAIEDNGHGFADGPHSVHFRKGLGLSSMRERVEFSGGIFKIQSREGKGTRIEVSWQIGEKILSGVSI